MSFAAIDRTAKSHHMGGELCGRLQGGLDIMLKNDCHLHPYLILDSYNLFESSYQEHGAGSLDLDVKSHYSGMMRLNPALGMLKKFSIKDNCLAFYLYAGYVLEMPVTQAIWKSELSGCCCHILTGQSFHKNRNQLSFGTSFKADLRVGPTLSLHYECNMGSNYLSHNASMAAGWSF